VVFSLFINRAPVSGVEHSVALQTAKAILAAKHDLYRVFFYAEGVCHYFADSNPGAGEWQALATGTSTELCLCSASAKQHGVIIEPHPNVSLGGLVQLLDAQLNSDRVVSLS